MTLQERIDSIAYPPTMTYAVESCTPTGFLCSRMDVINRVAPSFFEGSGKILLDIGCSKGFFSLLAKRGGMTVIGIDHDGVSVKLCSDIMPGSRFIHESFAEFSGEKVDRAFIGNGPHYLFRELGGSFGWIKKLAQFPVQEVLIEGPEGMDCADMLQCIPSEQVPAFNRTAFHSAMDSYFDLIRREPSPSPGRWVSLWKASPKKPQTVYTNRLAVLYSIIAHFADGSDRVVEVCTRHDRGVLSREIIPHNTFVSVDRDPERGDLAIDILENPIPSCDVLLSTAILHHHELEQYEKIIDRFTTAANKTIAFSGPDTGDIFGDHLSCVDADLVNLLMTTRGWHLRYSGHPCSEEEVLLVYGK